MTYYYDLARIQGMFYAPDRPIYMVISELPSPDLVSPGDILGTSEVPLSNPIRYYYKEDDAHELSDPFKQFIPPPPGALELDFLNDPRMTAAFNALSPLMVQLLKLMYCKLEYNSPRATEAATALEQIVNLTTPPT